MTTYSHNSNCVTPLATSNNTWGVVFSASSIYSGSYDAWRAFDRSSYYGWSTAASVLTGWISVYSGGSTWVVTSYTITQLIVGPLNGAPKDWILKGSVDGSAWVNIDTQSNQTSWSSGEMRTYTVSSPGFYKYYKLDISANNGSTNYLQIGELELIGPVSLVPTLTSNTSSSAVTLSASGGETYAWMAFDNSYELGWYTTGTSGWLEVAVNNNVYWTVLSYSITSGAYTGYPNPDPKTWYLQGSNDGSNWTVIDFRSNETFATAYSVNIYTITGTPRSYKYFRINITENNGWDTYTGLGELVLIGWVGEVVAEDASTIDSVDSFCIFPIDVSETNLSDIVVDCTASFEVTTNEDSSNSSDYVDVFQDFSICDVSETTEFTDSNESISGIGIDVSESSEGTDSVEGLSSFADYASESIAGSDLVDCFKWSGISIEIDESLIVIDSALYSLFMQISDAIAATDSISTVTALSIIDYILFSETQIANHRGTKTLTETINLEDIVSRALALGVTDTAAVTDSTSLNLFLLIEEYIDLLDSQTVSHSGTKTLTESLGLSEFIQAQLQLSLSDAIAASDSATVRLLLQILESLGFNEVVSSAGVLALALADTANADDSVQLGFVQAISEALSIVDTASTIGSLVNSISEALSLADTTSGNAILDLIANDSFSLVESLTSQGYLYNIVYDVLSTSVEIQIDDEIWECYVLNTPKFHPSVYTGYDFNSFCIFNNVAYGCKEDGIYSLDGEVSTEDPFQSGVMLSKTNFGVPNRKRFTKAVLGVTGDSVLLKVESDNGEAYYTLDSFGETIISRGTVGKKWIFKVANFEELNIVNLFPVVLVR